MPNNAQPRKYIGIDLGTTNSAIACGWIDTRTNQFISRIIETDMQMDANGVKEEKSLLPSATYFPPKGAPIIGNHAEAMLQEQPGAVAKSMKRCMDKGNVNFLGTSGVSWTPIQVSAGILSQLKHEASKKFKHIGGFPDKDIMITVPASFESTMREATLTAASEAGFNITEDNLLDEPHAALHHFCNKPIVDSIDFSDKKLFLVFDLGGGTLDVSLHRVSKDRNGLIIEDIAVSPYTRFGGDDFDEQVAEELLKHYRCPKELKDSEMNLLKFQFQAYAEETKIQLSNQIRGSLATNPLTNPSYKIIKQPNISTHPNLPGFQYDLSWNEYKDIIQPFLASDLELESALHLSGSSNIINPILNVLDEGKKTLCWTKRPEVDVVLLNGGMTKLPVIRQRLENFFATKVVRYEVNPDEAVALGAVVYQTQ